MKYKKNQGFSLIELLLVVTIMSVMTLMVGQVMQQQMLNKRINLTAEQMQQVMTAGMAYYVNTGKWPTALSDLQNGNYLPSTFVSPWGQASYTISGGGGKMMVSLTIPASISNPTFIYKLVAGKLPFASTTSMSYSQCNVSLSNGTNYTVPTCDDCTPYIYQSTSSCTVSTPSTSAQLTAVINLPSQNPDLNPLLSNASEINFAGIYHHGACIPVPNCPADSNGQAMTPQVILVPISVGGYMSLNSDNVSPISAFNAYTKGGSNSTPANCDNAPGYTTSYNGSVGSNCTVSNKGLIPGSNAYWRACLQIVADQGDITSARSNASYDIWGNKVSMVAFTRCTRINEANGTNFTLYYSE